MTSERTWIARRLAVGTATLLAAGALAAGTAALVPQLALAGGDAALSSLPAQSATVDVAQGGTYDTTGAHALLERINEIRAEAGADPVAWSASLEAAAQTRAVEHAFDTTLAHTRPNGQSALDPISSALRAENLAAGSGMGAAQLLELWYAEKAAYDANPADPGAANYANLVSPDLTYVGLSSFTSSNGTCVLTAAFGNTVGGAADVAADGYVDAAVAVATSSLGVQLSLPSTLEIGQSGDAASYSVLYRDAPIALASPASWLSSDTSVATVDAATGIVTAVAAGSATITLTTSAGTPLGSATVAVVEPTALSATLPDGADTVSVEYGADPTALLPTSASVSWSNGTVTDEPIVWDAIDPQSCLVPDSSFTVSGSAAGLPIYVQVSVGSLTIASLSQPEDIETCAGVPAELPAYVQATWSDGSVTSEAVDWDHVDDAWWQSAGSFDVAGTVAGCEQPVTVHVVVAEAGGSDNGESDPQDGMDPGAPDIDSGANGETGGQTGSTGEEPNGDGAAAVVSYTNPDDIYVLFGEPWEPADHIDVVLSDGTATTVTPAWSDRDGASPDSAVPDETGLVELVFDLTVDGASQTVVQNVHMVDMPVDALDISCLVGETPSLPATVSMEFRGVAVNVPVSWEPLPEGAGTAAGTFTVAGTVAGTLPVVTATITVEDPAPSITALKNPAAVDTVVGTMPELPPTVEATFADGTTGQVDVDWTGVEPQLYAQEGTFVVTGTVQNSPLTVQVTVNVRKAEATPSEAPQISLSTTTGVAPSLPETIEVAYSDGSTKQVKVVWDAIDPSLYAQPGSFSLSGTLEGIDAFKATALVTVADLTATTIKSPAVETSVGVAPTLPETVEVTWSDDSITTEKVTWDAIDAASYAKAGTFTVTGTIERDAAAKAICTVTVKAAPATPVRVENPENVDTDAGVAPKLPETVTVTYSDGTTKQHAVTWDAIDASSYHNGGSFIISGNVNDTDLTVRTTVVVAAARVTGVQNNLAVQTTVGVAPKLPATASIRWSNGDVSDEKVAWTVYDAALYGKKGTFTVQGTVAGYSVSCTVTVLDQVVKTGDALAGTTTVAIIGGIVGAAVVAAAVALLVRSRKHGN